MWLYLSTCDPSHIAKSTHTVKECCSVVWLEAFSPPHQFGQTLELSTPVEEIGFVVDTLTSSMAASRARGLALQALEKAWQTSEAGYFTRSLDCVAKYDPNLSSWKMYRPLHQEAAERWSEKLPRWAMIVDGALYPLLPLERYTVGKGGSYWPTPTASQAGKPIRHPSPTRVSKKHGYDLQDKIGETFPLFVGMRVNVLALQWIMGYQMNWTKLEPWAMQWFHSKRKKRSKS